MYELQPKLDSRKSFYKKAMVEEINDGVKYLISYSTKVAGYINENIEVYGIHSPTTLRHIKEFIFQMNGETGLTKSKIEKKYLIY